MISKSAVRKFEKRKRISYSWMKRLKRKVVWDEVNLLLKGSGFRFKTAPYLHQLVCWYIGVCEGSFLFLLDMGGGKTKIILDIFGYYRKTRGFKKILVLVPNIINIDAWAEEVEIHSDLRVMMLEGTTQDRWEAVQDEDCDVYVVNYQGLLHMVCKNKGRGKLEVNESKVKRLCSKFDMLVLDESHSVKNKESLTFRVCNRITKQVQESYALTGTPTGRNPQDFWAQFFLIDKGWTLGETLTVFRQALFTETEGFAGRKEWSFDKRKKHRLHQWIQNRSIRYSDHEMADLPREHRQVIKVKMGPEQEGYYDTFRSGLIERVKEHASFKKLDNYYIRLRQISSGFLDWKDEETGKRSHVDFDNNGKLDAVDYIVSNLPEGHKLIIFVEFNPSGAKVCELLRTKKVNHAKVFGNQKDKLDQIRKFRKDRDCVVLVANSRAAGQGGNLQVANYACFYESPSSPIVRKQAERRMSGPRQKLFKHVHFYDLVASKTEEKQQEYLKEGKDLFEAVVNGKEVNI